MDDLAACEPSETDGMTVDGRPHHRRSQIGLNRL
jgi:hypothetical protein